MQDLWTLTTVRAREFWRGNGQPANTRPSISLARHGRGTGAEGSVWLQPGSDTAWRTLPAQRPQPGVFQAGSDSSSVSERPRTAIPVGLLGSGRRCRHSAAPALSQPSTACSTSLPAQHLRPLGLFNCRPHSLELFPGFHPRPDHQCRLFQTFAWNVPVRSMLVHLAL